MTTLPNVQQILNRLDEDRKFLEQHTVELGESTGVFHE